MCSPIELNPFFLSHFSQLLFLFIAHHVFAIYFLLTTMYFEQDNIVDSKVDIGFISRTP
jgi:hypothetical protein